MVHPITIVYHRDCADGSAAAWAAWRALKDDPGVGVQYITADYDDSDVDIGVFAGRHVIILDFSYKVDVLKQIDNVACSVLIIDHHKTAKEDLSDISPLSVKTWPDYKKLLSSYTPISDGKAGEYDSLGLSERWSVNAIFDMEHSGAMLAWTFFHGRQSVCPYLIKLVEDRDLWIFKYELSKAINIASLSLGDDLSAWDEFAKDVEKDAKAIAESSKVIEQYRTAEIQRLLRHSFTMRIHDHDFPVVNAPRSLRSEVAHALSEKTGSPYTASYYDTAVGRRFSLRGTKDCPIDLDRVAKLFGGGGHRTASGFTVPMSKIIDPGTDSSF